jgi:hypothetical protein
MLLLRLNSGFSNMPEVENEGQTDSRKRFHLGSHPERAACVGAVFCMGF